MSEKEPGQGVALTAAQRARIERNRLRARALQDSRLVQRPSPPREGAPAGGSVQRLAGALDTGGGFLLEETEATATSRTPAPPPPAPMLNSAERPLCQECGRPFSHSYLFDTFDFHVCDECRDDEKHSLMTRTEAKNEYLLKDCDLDSRPPPLRCVRRRNPHSARFGDMRLYVRAQVEARALELWGSEAALEEERARRLEGRARLQVGRTRKRLRALRMDVRSSLFDRSHATHEHAFGAERAHSDDEDMYSRECRTCGYIQTYEKM